MRPSPSSTWLPHAIVRLAVRNRSSCHQDSSAPARSLANGVSGHAKTSHLHSLARPNVRPSTSLRALARYTQTRSMTAERKAFVIKQLKVSGKFLIYSYIIGGIILATVYVINEEVLERAYPTPAGWTYFTRSGYRNAKGREEPEAFAGGVVDWVATANRFKKVVRRLEDPRIDGEGLKEQARGAQGPERLTQTGYDITDKSDPWRRGYYEALMGAAKGAENLDGFLRDDTRGIVFPPDVVVGPSNSNPRPVPPRAQSAPLEENCSPAFDSPHHYYHKILTTEGFTRREIVQAALAYGDWLHSKHVLAQAAKAAHRRAVSVAVSSLEQPHAVVDGDTCAIKSDAPVVTPNVLLATQATGIYYAQISALDESLPILVSVLRARRSLPAPPPPEQQPEQAPAKKDPDSIVAWAKSAVLSLLYHPPFPPRGPSGDEQAVRTKASICEEAGVMANIGEILYVSSSPTDGLSWTRQAVDVAEDMYRASETDEEASRSCKQCLEVAMDNWVSMVTTLANKDRARKVGPTEEHNETEQDTAAVPVPVPASVPTSASVPASVPTLDSLAPEKPKNTSQQPTWIPSLWQASPPPSSSSSSPSSSTKPSSEIDWETEQALVNEKARAIKKMLRHDRFPKKGGAWVGLMLFN
ncbi:MAG: hypothetical protein M1815_001749 [Lichina confinis]|nr:MAG: hypothetical protein M1815_001749 [Lichina confinis]